LAKFQEFLGFEAGRIIFLKIPFLPPLVAISPYRSIPNI
jgi:hypothetical protein